MEAANRFLAAAYWPDHNARFARRPVARDDFHLAVPHGLSLATVFRLEETRTVSNDWVVRYANRYLQLERQSHQPPARSTVQVFEDAAGQIEIRYRDLGMRWTEIAGPRLPTLVAEAPALPRCRPASARRYEPSADHFWYGHIDDFAGYQQATAARRKWIAAQP